MGMTRKGSQVQVLHGPPITNGKCGQSTSRFHGRQSRMSNSVSTVKRAFRWKIGRRCTSHTGIPGTPSRHRSDSRLATPFDSAIALINLNRHLDSIGGDIGFETGELGMFNSLPSDGDSCASTTTIGPCCDYAQSRLTSNS